MRLLRDRLRPYTSLLVGIVVLQIVGTIASLYLPSLNADIINKGIAVGDTGYIWRIGGWMLVVAALQVICSIAATYLAARTAMGFGRDTRAAVFNRVAEFSAREVGQFGAPSLITRSTNDVQQVQMLVVMGATLLVMAPIMMVGGVVMALKQDVGLSWLMLVSVPILGIAVTLIIRRMVPLFRRNQELIDNVNGVLREQITGIRVVRAFVREQQETDRFAVANQQLTTVAIGAGRYMAMIFPVVMLVLNVSSVAVLWFGGHRVEEGNIDVGSLTAFLAYLMQILMSVMMASFMMMMLPRATVSAERIQEVLDTESSVVPPSSPVRPQPGAPSVELENVSFAFPGADEPVLRNLTFAAQAGQTTAVIGSTGAGKTTMLNLIPRLVDVTGGEVRINGVDVRQLDPEVLWNGIGLVPQRPYLFSGTVASNLRYGNPDATDDELWQALAIAQADDFVTELGGLETKIAQGGTNVSGGQRQRISIARALVRRPDIYLFDDSFSALDLGTDARLRAALRPVTRDSVLIVVAQRVSTIIDADQIIVLDDGAVVGHGTHEDLLVSCPTYAEIVESQAAVEVA
ncbi:ABC transporter ATP-binding protein [Cumulibacter soli]|uniref:ABC transporter ATP-binding protein n=1 Tax=Cumulibacter soli TaxID=2546344 RepID=UPI001FBA6121|nr:ABC transporter ATP-binding protein [Cumulibacter soli]